MGTGDKDILRAVKDMNGLPVILMIASPCLNYTCGGGCGLKAELNTNNGVTSIITSLPLGRGDLIFSLMLYLFLISLIFIIIFEHIR